jgi:biotin synthase
LDSPTETFDTLFSAAGALRLRYRGRTVNVQVITSVKSGDCGEDCVYCAQSSTSEAEIPRFRIIGAKNLLKKSLDLAASKIDRHCLGFSGLRYDDKEMATICGRIAEIRSQCSTPICCSIGLLTVDQIRALKEAGVGRINHNLNTSAKFYSKICSTHDYGERLANLRRIKEGGLEICCGGIVGMGEEKADVVSMLFDIRELGPSSVPINFYVPVEGTTLAEQGLPPLTPIYCLKVLALARLLMPRAEIRCSAGREKYLTDWGSYVFAAADSIFAEGYLTVGGQGLKKALDAIKAAGYEANLLLS